MGTICSTTRKTFKPLQRAQGFTITLQTDAQRNVQLSGVPKTYQDLLHEAAQIYTVPKAFMVLKTVKNGREFCICDEETYLTAVGGMQTGNAVITVFFPDRHAIATKSTVDPLPPIEPERQDIESWGILHPVPIDVEMHSRSSISQSRHSSLFLAHKEPRTVQCLQSCLLMFDAVTGDSFKYLADTIDEGSRSVQLTPTSLVVTGGCQYMSQHLRLDIADASFKRLSNLRIARHNHATVCMLGIVWVIGGMGDTALTECELFDGEEWRERPGMNIPRVNFTACTWGTIIYVYGGNCEASIEKYERESWVELSLRLPSPLSLLGVYQESDEIAVIAGGRSSEPESSAYRLQLDTGTCEVLSSLPIPDYFVSEAILYRDEIYFQGVIKTQLYSPTTDRWRVITPNI